jgi:hypothetical protein
MPDYPIALAAIVLLFAHSGNTLAAADRPLNFEENRGQADARVKFLVRSAHGALLLKTNEAILVRRANTAGPAGMRMQFIGADPVTKVTGVEALPGKVNYLIGNDPRAWQRNIPTYARVKYTNIYPRTDLTFYGNQQQLEYDFMLAPGADPHRITLRFAGSAGPAAPRVDANGDLVLNDSAGEIRFHKPVVYQGGATPRSIDGRYVLRGDATVGFAVAAYDHSRALIIDPVLTYSTYLGGSDDEGIFGIRFDNAGNIYVAGETSSLNFPTAHSFQANLGGDYDGFITKFDPTGSRLIYSTYLGGTLFDHCAGLAVDGSGSAFVAGITQSADFPVANAIQPKLLGQANAFVARLDPSGSTLVFSTYLGGSGYDQAADIGLDAQGNAYLAGSTTSTNFPITPGAYQTVCDQGAIPGTCIGDAFVAKVSASGSKLLYSTYLGGGGSDTGLGIAVDPIGSVYVTGQTLSTNFPLMNPYQANLAGPANAFVTKFNPQGNGLVFSTYLGGNGYDAGFGIAIDSLDRAYVTGNTSSTNFPTVNPFQPVNAGGSSDGFISKFTSSGEKLMYSTYFGGTGMDFPFRVAVDAGDNAAVIGFTASLDFPVVNAIQPVYGGGDTDGFVIKFDSAGSQVDYSTYLGGTGDEYGYAIHADGAGNIWVGGSTSSLNFPLMKPYQGVYGGGPFDAFLSKLSPNASPAEESYRLQPAHPQMIWWPLR